MSRLAGGRAPWQEQIQQPNLGRFFFCIAAQTMSTETPKRTRLGAWGYPSNDQGCVGLGMAGTRRDHISKFPWSVQTPQLNRVPNMGETEGRPTGTPSRLPREERKGKAGQRTWDGEGRHGAEGVAMEHEPSHILRLEPVTQWRDPAHWQRLGTAHIALWVERAFSRRACTPPITIVDLGRHFAQRQHHSHQPEHTRHACTLILTTT